MTTVAEVDDNARPQLARHVRLRFDEARGQHVLLLPETILAVNDTGAAIVELCDGRRTVAEIETELAHRFDRVAEDEVSRFVTELVAMRGMEVADDRA